MNTRPTLLAQAALLLALGAASAAFADPYESDADQVQSNTRPVEGNASETADAWSVHPQSPADRLAFRFQAELGRDHSGGPRWREVSVQGMVGLTPDNAYGVAGEINYDPAEKETEFQVFAFGSREVGPTSIEAEIGLVRSAHDTGWAYAWRLQRSIGESFSAGLEGEGEEPLGHGIEHEREHLAGPSVTLKTPGGPVEFRLGYLLNLKGGEDRVVFGLEVQL